MLYVSRAIFIALMLPLLPLAGLVYLGDKLSKAKWAERWAKWADKKARDITGV
uniref:Uncharacterized protein n=1 Tax=Klebsiella phage BUCT640 TaxID=3153538 RepID=A0AAU7J8C6_9CAUD